MDEMIKADGNIHEKEIEIFLIVCAATDMIPAKSAKA
jgi:uncharacterized tellurite resistance protein B-like protein